MPAENLFEPLPKEVEPRLEREPIPELKPEESAESKEKERVGIEAVEPALEPVAEQGILQKLLRRRKPADDQAGPLPPQQLQIRSDVEKILEGDLQPYYLAMTVEQRQVFRAKGEATASVIAELIYTAKLRFRKLLGLLLDWLSLLPGVNRLFVEQESKIRADRIMRYAERGQLPPSEK